MPLDHRMAIITELKCVDKVVPQKDKNKQKMVDKFNVNAIVVGSDWKINTRRFLAILFMSTTQSTSVLRLLEGTFDEEILETFDINNLLIKEYKHWYLLLRKRQVTIGSLVN